MAPVKMGSIMLACGLLQRLEGIDGMQNNTDYSEVGDDADT